LSTQTFVEARKICQRHESTWTERDNDIVYWWYWHEMEDPTEEALRYCIKTYIHRNNVKWCRFLMERFPSEENLELVKKMIGYDQWRRGSMLSVMRGMLKARPLSQNHIDLVSKYGSKAMRVKARKIETRLYEI